MDPRVKARFSDAILRDIAGRYGARLADVRLIGGFESIVHEMDRGGRTEILRVAHDGRRSVDMIRGECDWLAHLESCGVPVAAPRTSDRGELVETVDDGHGGRFVATAFVKAPGRRPRRAEVDAALLEREGELLGRLHEATIDYVPSDAAWRRPDWDDIRAQETAEHIPEDQPLVRAAFDGVMTRLRALPRTRESFGLIHRDAHAGNYHVDDDGSITLFDFDDSCYAWFVEELAIVLFYAVMWPDLVDTDERAAAFWRSLVRGYRRVRDLDPRVLPAASDFLLQRELGVYAVIHRSYDVADPSDPWVRWFLEGRRARLESGRPLCDPAALRAP